MPTITLTFTLPEEQSDYDAARRGPEALRVLWQIDQRLRHLVKHEDRPPDTRALAEEIRDMIRDSSEDLTG